MEMTKWMDTNYHYIVPEFTAGQTFRLTSDTIFKEYAAARELLGDRAKPVLTGPVSYLLAGKEKEAGFERIDLIRKLVPVYVEILQRLRQQGARWIQLDEPCLALDLSPKDKAAFEYAYNAIAEQVAGVEILIATYFEGLLDNTALAVNLPVAALHIDLVRAPEQLNEVLAAIPDTLQLSLGVVDGRNVWKNDYSQSLALIQKAADRLGKNRIFIAPRAHCCIVP